MSSEDKIDAVQKRLEKNIARAADELSDSAIGNLTLSLLEKREAVTVEALLGLIEVQMAATPSAQGKATPGLDGRLQRLLAARRRLEQIA